ncbi:hypothetical protein [Muriicola sp. Z0-33]|uniref:hypothetical protein n=1 Tax=Muriicola sp. Z0-33 TaxID=2816957 RepID=UPI00223893F4|nr:hypothetical protein [Muriicola sp. Z0-33]MCW5516690.1 hypothetical protein [Muriicola sp. Z0-33]
MKRVLIDYKKLSREIATLLIETYPDGYGDDDIIAFRNGKGEFIEAVELRTDDTLYMVKISQSLSHFIANFDDSIERELENKSKVSETDFSSENDSGTDSVELELNTEHELDEEAGLD